MGFTSKTTLFTLALTLASFLFVGNAESNAEHSEGIHVVEHDLRSDLVDLCHKTTNPKLCLDTIKPHFLKSAVTPIKALEVEVDATRDQTVKTMDAIGTSLAESSASNSLKDSLAICKDQYHSILDAIKETKEAIKVQDFSTAKLKFSSVLSYQASCKDAFEGMEKEFAFSNDNDAVFQLGGNCLDIISDMEKAENPTTPQPTIPEPAATTEPLSVPTTFKNVIGTIS
ncbi:unnamed protein product [Lathyrus oleraceus]|uniref:Pectinesterase inhibitor domain-containing protein n=1 Tax=Pisum sativum TaxID=3888 RepID=A0A9D5GZK1_PEA|nr:uncharacterized protein LOC127115828 [Pisum sativum]KAI5446868.1 hypothetical protein KIW84_014637 [Pisum sativum]